MAIPPDPIEEVLPSTQAAVIAAVTRVVQQDSQPPFPPAQPGATSVRGGVVARQVVELEVREVLFGEVSTGAKLEVVKPAGDYTLSPGNSGPFLLNDKREIVGRYGPDSYSRETIVSAAKQAGRK